MKIIKKLIKGILGRSSSPARNVTIDICERTTNGFIIAGWYFEDCVTSVSLITASSNEPIQSNVIPVVRDDVFEHTKKKACGFEIIIFTKHQIEDLLLLVEKKEGEFVKQPLSLTSSKHHQSAQFDADTTELTEDVLKLKLNAEYVLITKKCIFIDGWYVSDALVNKLSITDSSDKVIASLHSSVRYARKDIQQAFNLPDLHHGVIARFDIEKPDFKENTNNLYLRLEKDEAQVKIPLKKIASLNDTPINNLQKLLRRWVPHDPEHLQAYELFIPFVKTLYPAGRSTEVCRHVFGDIIENPGASLVIPIFGRYDFIRYQLSHFARHPDYNDVEIIYVIDDPSIKNEVSILAENVFSVFQFPFVILQLKDNLGFGKACNVGVSYASSKYVGLINSDVMPADGSWLSKMLDVVHNKENCGIVGARLLYEDGKIQHDGMAPYLIKEYPGYYFNDHPNKGSPNEDLSCGDPVEKCDLLTAACWVMKKEIYEQAGGLDPAYVLGDFEDSDLCFRLLELGKTNYIVHDITLYHLERQSQNMVETGGWKHNLTILNAITFNNKWRQGMDDLYKRSH